MVSIPLSLASGLVAVYALGFNLSQLVVAGFILSLGLLVDDSIVVIENVSRHLRMGKERMQAAIAHVFARAKAHDKAAGILAPVEADARRYLEMGATVVAVGSDLGVFRGASQALRDKYL